MKMFLILVLATLALNAEAGRNRNREVRQEKRIAQGVQSGELTNHETKKLLRGQKKIDRYQNKAHADGEMSAEEKLRLEKMQDRQSKKIDRQKHDNQERPQAEQPPVENN